MDNREEQRRRNYIREKKRRRRQRAQIKRALLIAAMLIVLILLILSVRMVVKAIKSSGDAKKAVSTDINPKKESDEKSITILTAGDIIIHAPFLSSSSYYDETADSYDYDAVFTYCKDAFTSADFAVADLEGALTGKEEGYSGYPMFHSPDEIVDAMVNSGIDMCLLANNHIYDGFDDGFYRTMEVMKEKNLLFAGARETETEKTYVIQEINGIKIGFLDYVYETESDSGQKSINSIEMSDKTSPLLNSFHYNDLDSFYQDVESNLSAMKEEGVQYSIAYMHWGEEYHTEESDIQRKMAQKLCDLGVDMLIGSHPHVIQPVDVFTSSDNTHTMPCAFAIGNLLSNQRREHIDQMPTGETEDGLFVTLSLTSGKDGTVTLTDMEFTPTWVYHSEDPAPEYYILPLDETSLEKSSAQLGDIDSEVQESISRTEKIIGPGVEKVKQVLPISQ